MNDNKEPRVTEQATDLNKLAQRLRDKVVGGTHPSFKADILAAADALTRQAAPEAHTEQPYGYHYEWAACITADGPQHFRSEFNQEPPPQWAIEKGQARNVTPLFDTPSPATQQAGASEPIAPPLAYPYDKATTASASDDIDSHEFHDLLLDFDGTREAYDAILSHIDAWVERRAPAPSQEAKDRK